MAITSSIFRISPLVDGLLHVEEQHVDSTGKAHKWFYCASATTDQAAKLAEHSAIVEERLAAEEMEALLNG